MGKRFNRWQAKKTQWARERARRLRRDDWRKVEQVPFVCWCPRHEKKAMRRPDAKRLIKILNEPGMRSYQCTFYPTLDLYHVGHMPRNVRLGYVSAAEIYGGKQDDRTEAGDTTGHFGGCVLAPEGEGPGGED